jgi:hypothetical protein
MRLPITGGCLCGAIRYQCDAPPLAMLKCHCRDCQQASGGPYAPILVVPWKSFQWTTGIPHHHATTRLHGRPNVRGFCGKCGAPLSVGEDRDRDRLGLMAGSLDDPAWFEPGMEIFTCDAQPWDLLDEKLPQHPQYARA